MYASSYSTGYAAYTFDFSGIPSGAVIEEMEVRCYGHRENNTIDSRHISQCVLYRGSTETDKLYVKKNGNWKEVQKAYRKVNGSWTEITDLTTVFTAGTKYVCGD